MRVLAFILLAACGSAESSSSTDERETAETAANETGANETAESGPTANDPRLADVVQTADFAEEHADYSSYWHAGLAELSHYDLTQTRYGEPRRGSAVFVFVTEPFLPEEQVKHDEDDGKPDVGILKFNATRRFITGIYPYNIMTSSFTPTDGSPSLKVASTVSEWCGMSFAQINRREEHIEATVRSYNQSEGDRDFTIDENVPFEDGLWQELRRDPSALPVGALRVVPALHSLDLYGKKLEAYDAVARLEQDGDSSRYVLRYGELDRELVIEFDTAFPHSITVFQETQEGDITRGVLTHSIMDAYWGHTAGDDAYLRGALGLEPPPHPRSAPRGTPQ